MTAADQRRWLQVLPQIILVRKREPHHRVVTQLSTGQVSYPYSLLTQFRTNLCA